MRSSILLGGLALGLLAPAPVVSQQHLLLKNGDRLTGRPSASAR
ncbi:MAG: hypothetical protein ACREMM_08805 [Gemmatimonadales bacterium]